MLNIFQLLTPCAKIEVLEMFEDKDFNKTGFNAESTMMKESYDEMLDEMGASVLKGYDASRLLRETDPIAYQVGMNDYESSILAEVQELNTEGNLEHALAFMFDDDEELTPEGEKNLKEMYDDMLDEMGVEVMLNNYDASRLLEETDPIAYRVGLSDYESSMESDMYDDMSPYEKIARRNVGMAESGLTRLTSDHPKFDPQKADRNKDGKISSWERTVGNEVAKSMGAETDERKFLQLVVEYNLPGDPEYINDLLTDANMKIIEMTLNYRYGAESFNAETFEAKVGSPQYKKAFGKMMAKYDIETNPEKKAKIITEMKRKFPAFFGAETFEAEEKKVKSVIESAMKKYDEYVADKEAYDDDDIISFEEWFDSHLGDDELQGDEETLEYLKTLPSYNSPDSNDWIWKMYHGAENLEAESVIIHGTKKGKKAKPIAHKISVEERDGFVPNRINIPSQLNPPYTVETSSLKTGDFENHAESQTFEAKGIDTLAEPFEEIGISLPYARLGVMAAGLTALAFGVKKYMKK